jgi:hypothetical protein
MPLTVPSSLLSLETAAGAAMLAAQPPSALAWPLLSHFATQSTQSFCSLATACVMLNALGVPAPVDQAFAPYPYFTQANVLGACALSKPTHKPGEPISPGFIGTHGATLDEFHAYLACWADTSRTHASRSTAARFREEARAALDSHRAVGINFYRGGLEEVGGGHMSPLGAYDAAADCFLLLDVSRYKYPAVWVRTDELFAAMNTTDTTVGRSRGWVVVGAPAGNGSVSGGDGDALSGVERYSWADVRACIAPLARSDAHGVLACMAQPRQPLLASCAPCDGWSGGAVFALCLMCVALGAALTLGAQQHAAHGRRAAGDKLGDEPVKPALPGEL